MKVWIAVTITAFVLAGSLEVCIRMLDAEDSFFATFVVAIFFLATVSIITLFLTYLWFWALE